MAFTPSPELREIQYMNMQIVLMSSAGSGTTAGGEEASVFSVRQFRLGLQLTNILIIDDSIKRI